MMKTISKIKTQIPPDRLIILLACAGMLLSTLDTGIMNIALPFFVSHFHSATNLAAFSVSGYTMSLAAVIMFFGVLSDKIGKLKISLFGFLIFGTGSLLSGFSVAMSQLIVFRILQGIGAGAVQATSIALITTFIEKERLHAALGTLGIAIGAGPVLGPTIGGFFLGLGVWRWIFWINVPVIIAAVGINLYLLSHTTEPVKNAHLSIDKLGASLTFVTIVSLLSGLMLLKSTIGGLALLVLALIAACLLLTVEKRRTVPLFSLAAYRKSENLSLYLLETATFAFVSALSFLLPPFILEKVLGISPEIAGLFVLGSPIGLVIFSQLSGKLNQGKRTRLFAQLGLGFMLSAFLLLTLVLTFLHSQLTAPMLTFLLFIFGAGGGFFLPANMALISKSVPPTIQGEIGSLQRMVQNIGIALGTTIGSLILTIHQSLLSSIPWSWALGLLVLFLVAAYGWVQK